MRKIEIKEEDRILVIAPHPDDETIGCGGLLSLYGPQIDILIVTDGRKGHDNSMTDEECARVRKQEIMKVSEIAQIRKLFFMDIEDNMVYLNKKKFLKMDYSLYNAIFIPNRYEEHIDHRAVNKIIKSIIRNRHINSAIYEYEVWTPILYPNFFLDYSAVYNDKDALLSCYHSQLSIRDYQNMSCGLGLYRGVACKKKYVEAYEKIERQHILKSLFFKLPIKMQKIIYNN